MKKILKRLISISMCTFIMVAALFVPAAAAAGTTVTLDTSAIGAVNAGGTFTVPVVISGNTGLTSFGFKVSCTEGISLTSVSKTGCLCASGMLVSNIEKGNILWASASSVTADGTLFNLSFAVAESARGGDGTVSIAVKSDSASTETPQNNGVDVKISFVSGTVGIVGTAADPGNEPGGSTSQGGSTGGDPQEDDEKPAAGEKVTFYDVAEGSWYYSYVSSLATRGVINGYPDGSFKPQGDVTFGEALKLILLAAGYQPEAVEGGHWASAYLDLAVSEGFISGCDDLDAAIKRVEIAEIAAKALELGESTGENPFEDTDDEYVLRLYEAKIVEGSFDNGVREFAPQSGITRAEISAIIYRINAFIG